MPKGAANRSALIAIRYARAGLEPLRRWGRLVLFASLAAVSLVTVYSTASLEQFSEPAGISPYPVARFLSSYPAEPGPDGFEWQWMSGTATLEVTGQGRFWIGFRARSYARPRSLRLTGGGVDASLRVTRTPPATYIAGPITASGRTLVVMRTSPSPRARDSPDPRRLSVFLSTPRLSRSPVVALPGEGFYSTERELDRHPFNWLRQSGRIDIASASGALRQAWLRFSVQSIDRARTLNVRADGREWELRVPAAGRSAHQVTVGPVALRDGRASLRVRAASPAQRYGADPRPLSVRIDRLEAVDHPVSPPRGTQ